MRAYTHQDRVEFTVRKGDRDYGSQYGKASYAISRMVLVGQRGKSRDEVLAGHPVIFRAFGYSQYPRKTYGEFLRSAYMDVSVQFRYFKKYPVYRVIFTPRRHISQEAINKLPPKGVVLHHWGYALPFMLPKDRTLISGQMYTNWTYCGACLVKNPRKPYEPSSGKALGEFFRKLNQSNMGSDFDWTNKSRSWNNPSDLKTVMFFSHEDEKQYSIGRYSWRFKVAKFNAKDSVLARANLINLEKAYKARAANSEAANKAYHDFIRKTYEPLTAKYFLHNKLHCGDYEFRYVNRSAEYNAKFIPVNKHYLRCLSARFKDYDLKGYLAKYPELKRQESALWNKTYGTKRASIGTPEEQVQAFKKRYKEIDNETKDMIYHANRAAENAARAERSRQGWANVLNNAMAQVRQDNQFIADHGLVVTNNNTVMTVKQARESAMQAAKMQAMLDSAKSRSASHPSYDETPTGSSSKFESTSHQATQVAQNNTQTPPTTSQSESEKARVEKEKQLKADQEQAKLEKEKRLKAEQEKARLAKEKREKAKLEEARRRKAKLEQERLAREKTVYTVAYTWQAKSGLWWACGPVQCLWAGEHTEKQALDGVIGNKSIVGKTRVYRCYQYKLSGKAKDTAGDLSEAQIRRGSVCKIGQVGDSSD